MTSGRAQRATAHYNRRLSPKARLPVTNRPMLSLLAAACGLFCAASWADSPTKLLRFPDVHTDWITFVYAGDIYLIGANGGTAQRLTSHAGNELYPKFSPDG